MTATALKQPEIIYTARRFGLPDLNDMANWLVPRLARSWPHLQNQTIFGWFRGMIDSSEFFFVRTDHAVSLSQQVHERLSAFPVVREHFTLAKSPEHVEEAAFLYTEIKQWAFRLGAAEVLLQDYPDEQKEPELYARRLTDVPRDLVRPAFGRIFIREVLFAKIGQRQ
jgi:hypothetical protein